MSLLLAILMFGMWTSIFSISKLTLVHCSPIFLTSARMILAGLILIGWLFLRKREDLKLTIKQILPIFLLAVFSIYLTNICEFWSVQYLSSSKTCFIYSLSPFFAALFSYIHFKEKMNSRKWLGMLIGFAGVMPGILVQTGSEGFMGGISFLSWPVISMIGAAIFSVYGWVLLRILVKDTMSPVSANGYSMLIGGALALVHSFFVDSWSPFPVDQAGISTFIKGTLIMTLISNIICYNLYGYLLRKFTATFLSFLGLLSPLFASLNGWMILGETPSLVIILSTCVIITGLWIVYKEELKQGYIYCQRV